MDEHYYRDLIKRVYRNEKAMWSGCDEPNDGYDDFNMLWGLLFDEDARLSPATYFEAIEICLDSFFGSIQDRVPVWRNIASHYSRAMNSIDKKAAFQEEFTNFLRQTSSAVPDMEIFYDIMRVAVEEKDITNARLLTDVHSPILIEDFEQFEEASSNYPEWAAYTEGLTEFTADKLPDDPAFDATIKRLHSSFGDLPGMQKLNNLYHRHPR